MKHRDPETPEEWQDTIDVCHLYLSIDAQHRCLTVGTRRLNRPRCQELIQMAAQQHGITPREDAFARVMPLILSGEVVV